MNRQSEDTVFVLVACKNPVLIEASIEPDHSALIHYATSQDDIKSRINTGTPYKAILVTQQCVSWLSEEVCDCINIALPASDITVINEKSIGDALNWIIDQEDFAHENRILKTELGDHKLALQIAQQRIDEVNRLLEANGLQTMVQIVLSKIRHEINNPLTGVVGQAQLILRRPEGISEETLRRIETIEVLALRISEVFKNAEERFLSQPDTGQESAVIHQQ